MVAKIALTQETNTKRAFISARAALVCFATRRYSLERGRWVAAP